MKEKAEYPGIDRFRVIAALLVIAVHTSPLSGINETSNFILTGIAARIAVPFFFMTSGYFLFSDGKKTRLLRLRNFEKKTTILYAAAILFYLPLDVCSGRAVQWRDLPALLKDIAFDGTFYHLWYLPAVIAGAAIAWFLLKKCKANRALAVASLLYLIGLFGDSYYGLAENIPPLKSFYGVLFSFSDYTRNGIFFAPLFLLMGSLAARRAGKLPLKNCLIGLAASGCLLLTEGLLLHAFGVQRHDSMYLTLPLCMFFLFQCLLHRKGKSAKRLRGISMLVYLIHPAVIAAISGAAGAANLRWLLVDNGVVFYLCVASISFAAAVACEAIIRLSRRNIFMKKIKTDRAWAEISLLNLGHNAETLQKMLPEGCEIMAVVKANAYGHGAVEISRYLNRLGIRAFAVATIGEGIELRKKGVRGEILILGYTDPKRASELYRYRLSQTVVDAEHAAELNKFGKPVSVHIKVDTGMNRLGERYDSASEIANLFHFKNLKISGIFTHLCVCDSKSADDVAFTNAQIERFYGLLDELKARGITTPKIHIQSSYGVLNYPQLRCSCARIGIALYGALSTPDDEAKTALGLRPVLELKSKVAMTKVIQPGESVGYGRQFIAHRQTRIAVISIGYADGFPRSLSNQSCVLIRGRRAPVAGRICMDQFMADVTDIPDVAQGDIVTLIGRDGPESIAAEQLAAEAGTIANELLSRLGSRMERVFLTPNPGGRKPKTDQIAKKA